MKEHLSSLKGTRKRRWLWFSVALAVILAATYAVVFSGLGTKPVQAAPPTILYFYDPN